MVSVRKQWGNHPAKVASPRSYPDKIRGMIAFQIHCAQLLLTKFKSISSCSNLQVAPDPRRGTPTGGKRPPEKALLSPFQRPNIKLSSRSRSPGRKGSLKSLRKTHPPLWKQRKFSYTLLPIVNGFIAGLAVSPEPFLFLHLVLPISSGQVCSPGHSALALLTKNSTK